MDLRVTTQKSRQLRRAPPSALQYQPNQQLEKTAWPLDKQHGRPGLRYFGVYAKTRTIIVRTGSAATEQSMSRDSIVRAPTLVISRRIGRQVLVALGKGNKADTRIDKSLSRTWNTRTEDYRWMRCSSPQRDRQSMPHWENAMSGDPHPWPSLNSSVWENLLSAAVQGGSLRRSGWLV